tara:strand:+ start:223 stop:528 length:306 start_codon:yes stop_codon:yes gene_type:complete
VDIPPNILTCPKDFDKQKFKKICIDKLDKDSNFGVTSDEIEDIAALHVRYSSFSWSNPSQKQSVTIVKKNTLTKRMLSQKSNKRMCRQQIGMRRSYSIVGK